MSEQGPPQGPPERPHLTLVPEAGIPDAPLDASVAATPSGERADIHVPTVSEMAIPSRTVDGAISTLAQRRRRVSRTAQRGTESQASGDPSESDYPWLSKYPTDQLIAFVGLSRRTSSDTYDPKPVKAATDIILGRKLDQLEKQREDAKSEREAALPKRLRKIKNRKPGKHGESKNPVWDIERSDAEREHTLAELESLAKRMDPSYESSDGSISRMPGVASPKQEARNLLRRMDNMAKERKREEELRKNPALRKPTEEVARRNAAVANQTAEREAKLREQSEILSRRQRVGVSLGGRFMRMWIDYNTHTKPARTKRAAEKNYRKLQRKHTPEITPETAPPKMAWMAENPNFFDSTPGRGGSQGGRSGSESGRTSSERRRRVSAGLALGAVALSVGGFFGADREQAVRESIHVAARIVAAEDLGKAVTGELVDLVQKAVEQHSSSR